MAKRTLRHPALCPVGPRTATWKRRRRTGRAKVSLVRGSAPRSVVPVVHGHPHTVHPRRLPATDRGAATAEAPPASLGGPARPEEPPAVERVLVADDDPAVLALVADLLEQEGYHVRRAADGVAALAAVDGDPPDLVIADVQMPRLDGLSLAASLRQRGVPVVLMTAAAEHLSAAGVPLVPKPFDLDQLLAAVTGALDRHS